MRLSEAIGEAAFLTGRGFLTEQPIQQLRRGDRLVLGAFDLGIERRGDAMQAQLRDQRSQFVTHHHPPRRPARRSRRPPV